MTACYRTPKPHMTATTKTKAKTPNATRASSSNVICYLLHFDEPLRGRLHYIGSTTYDRRFQRWREHARGTGSAYTARYIKASIGFRVVRLWFAQDRKLERWLKDHRRANTLCPICSPNLPQPEPLHYAADAWMPTIGTFWK